MTQLDQKRAAKEFVKRWQAEEGNEDRQSRSFWIEFAQDLIGIKNPTHVLDFERKVHGRKIDVFYEDLGVLIEQKSRGVDLDKKSERSKKAGEETPYQQAKWYADNLPYSVRPRWIIVSNFDEFRIHDLDSKDPENDYVSIRLDELSDQLHLFGFLADQSASRLVKEKEISVQAGEIVGRLYKSLSAQYKNIETDKQEQRSLNMLIVRFVFLLYAEDAGILQEHQAFLNYMRKVEPEDMRQALIALFKVLDTPEDERDPYLNEKLAAFPYINGSLFADENIIIPQFTQQIKFDLLKEASQEFDWSGISPTIFGAAFESTLNPDTRREGGMHYTSIENIHKVIDPLFLDDLKDELATIEGEKVAKKRNLLLRQFQNKLAFLKIMDPACGSGNFLTESYLSLRKLENRILENLMGDQMGLGFSGDANPIKVSIDQFYGIEINDFAVAVAKTALWIAEEQMMDTTQEILLTPLDFLPLKSNDNIHEGNALRMDWNDVLPGSDCNYIIGNPPFYGASNCNTEQKQDIVDLFTGVRLANSLDYVSGWYFKAAEYIQGTEIRCALVSTSSIVMGEIVAPLWSTLMDRFDIKIDFAWRTFIWSNETSDQAHVHVVIIGFSCTNTPVKSLKIFTGEEFAEAENINPYLLDAPSTFIYSRSRPLCNVPKLTKGNQPSDGGNLIMETDEANALIEKYPDAADFIRPYIGARDLLHGGHRRVLWLRGADIEKAYRIPPIKERLDKVAEFRAASSAAPTRKKAKVPHLFFSMPQTDDPYLIIPRHSSERREYIPIAFEDPFNIASDAVSIIPGANMFMFGVLHSHAHNAWMRTVAGRLESRYRYSGGIVYNNFVWPRETPPRK